MHEPEKRPEQGHSVTGGSADVVPCDLELKGPTDLAGLLAWPKRVARQLWERGDQGQCSTRRQLFQAHLQGGVLAVSDFSGWDSQRQAVGAVVQEFQDKQGLTGCQPWWVRSTDLGRFPQQYLNAVSAKEGGLACVFEDVCDRLPADWRTSIKKTLASCKTPAEKKEVGCERVGRRWHPAI